MRGYLEPGEVVRLEERPHAAALARPLGRALALALLGGILVLAAPTSLGLVGALFLAAAALVALAAVWRWDRTHVILTPDKLLVVGGLAVLGLFAARDALRSAPAPASSARTTSSIEKRRHPPPVIATPPQLGDKDRLAAEIQALGAGGILYVTDATCHRYLLG